jgi:thiol:disulfide interchange protein DsbC
MFRIVISVLCTGFFLTAAAAEPDIKVIQAALAQMFPGNDFGSLKVRPSAIPGLLEAEIDTSVFYVTPDGKHIVLGDLVDTQTRSNLSDQRRQTLIAKAVQALPEKNMIVLPVQNARRTITVFTDVDCVYCRRMHLQDAAELGRQGVKVRYILFPRQGPGSETYKRAVAVWCAADRVKAVGDAKAGKQIEMKSCANPVDENLALAEKLGVNGTPAIFLDDGRRTPGYVPAQRLLALMGLDSKAPSAAAK